MSGECLGGCGGQCGYCFCDKLSEKMNEMGIDKVSIFPSRFATVGELAGGCVKWLEENDEAQVK